jgi:hypothetical protein
LIANLLLPNQVEVPWTPIPIAFASVRHIGVTVVILDSCQGDDGSNMLTLRPSSIFKHEVKIGFSDGKQTPLLVAFVNSHIDGKGVC